MWIENIIAEMLQTFKRETVSITNVICLIFYRTINNKKIQLFYKESLIINLSLSANPKHCLEEDEKLECYVLGRNCEIGVWSKFQNKSTSKTQQCRFWLNLIGLFSSQLMYGQWSVNCCTPIVHLIRKPNDSHRIEKEQLKDIRQKKGKHFLQKIRCGFGAAVKHCVMTWIQTEIKNFSNWKSQSVAYWEQLLSKDHLLLDLQAGEGLAAQRLSCDTELRDKEVCQWVAAISQESIKSMQSQAEIWGWEVFMRDVLGICFHKHFVHFSQACRRVVTSSAEPENEITRTVGYWILAVRGVTAAVRKGWGSK